MSTFNPYTQWLYGLKPDQGADIRRWFGYLPYDTSHDFEIGMELNGIFWEDELRAIRNRIPKLRHGFVPKVSELANAIHDRSFQEMHMCRPTTFDLSRAGSERTVATLYHPDRLPVPKFERTTIPGQLPDDILISAGGSTYRCKPGEKLVGQLVAFNEVELHVDELMKLIEANPPMPSINPGNFNLHELVPQPLMPPPDRPYEEILAAVKKIKAWRDEQRSRQLTDGQVMQLCLHFGLYSLQAIQQFIEEYQR